MSQLAEGDAVQVDTDYCRACDLARHICPGCGDSIEHGQSACSDCQRTSFEPNEAAFLLAHCDRSKARWADVYGNAASHKDIVKRDEAAEKVARIDVVMDKIRRLTSE